MRLLSVNVGHPQLNPWKTMKLTGIDKRPVEGPVMVSRPRAKGMGMVGLAGDRVYDVRHHGGPDQAVYAYAREDLDFWAAELGRPLPNGMFGENLTTSGARRQRRADRRALADRAGRDPGGVLSADSVRHLPRLDGAGWLDQALYPGRAARARTSG